MGLLTKIANSKYAKVGGAAMGIGSVLGGATYAADMKDVNQVIEYMVQNGSQTILEDGIMYEVRFQGKELGINEDPMSSITIKIGKLTTGGYAGMTFTNSQDYGTFIANTLAVDGSRTQISPDGIIDVAVEYPVEIEGNQMFRGKGTKVKPEQMGRVQKMYDSIIQGIVNLYKSTKK